MLRLAICLVPSVLIAAENGAPVRFDFSSGAAPQFLSTAAADGNYRVTMKLGSKTQACSTTVRAESRRLMIENLFTAAGEFKTAIIAVNVRNSRLTPPPLNAPGGTEVRLNDREKGVLHWDDKLTLEFTGAHPCVDAVEIVKADELPTVFIAGDSTVTDQPREPNASWGQMLTRFFKPGIAIANHAESGETLKSFITGMRLDKMLSYMKAGDYLFIQFGHNDQKANWPQTYVEPLTTYKAYLKVFIAEARRRGATPVLVTSTHRRNFDEHGKIRNTLGDYPEAVRQTAREENVTLIDLNAMSAELYEALGPELSPVAFAANGRDATHHSSYGAYELAKCVVEGVRASSLDLKRFLADDVIPFNPRRPDLKFDFAAGDPQPGYIKVAPSSKYSKQAGFGFEDGSGKYFSVALPEGNNRVTVTLGDREAETVTTVKAELRRLMLEKVRTASGEFVSRSFVVNIRAPQIPGGSEVRLKDREKTSEAWAWDEKLTLEFSGARSAVRSVEITRVDDIPVIYLAGDSTVTDQSREPHNSWGQMLTRFFNDRVAIANHSESGESLKSFIGERRLAKVMSNIKPGDFLIVQMGHNDEKLTGEGVGAFTTYKADLKRFVTEARQHKATPILVTPMHRRNFGPDGKIVNTHGDFPDAVRQVAKEEGVALIDLAAMSKLLYEAMGPEESVKAFAPNDATHHASWGSYELARCIVEAIRKNDFGLKRYLAEDVTPYDPAHPGVPNVN